MNSLKAFSMMKKLGRVTLELRLLNRNSFLLMPSFSLVKGEDIAVVQSEDFDGTWNDWVALPISTAPECRPIQFTIHSPTGARR